MRDFSIGLKTKLECWYEQSYGHTPTNQDFFISICEIAEKYYRDCYDGTIAELQEKLLQEKQEKLNWMSKSAIAMKEKEICRDKLHRRNMLIKSKDKRIKELEAYNMTFGDKRDLPCQLHNHINCQYCPE